MRVKEGDDYLERVLLGYGQFGVITKARIKVRPYRPMAVRHFLYTDIGVALADMMRLVEQDAVDACAILTLRDDVVALILGFERTEPEDFPLRDTLRVRVTIATRGRRATRCVRGAGAMLGFLMTAPGGSPAGAARSALRPRRRSSTTARSFSAA